MSTDLHELLDGLEGDLEGTDAELVTDPDDLRAVAEFVRAALTGVERL